MLLVNERNKYNLMDELWKLKCKLSADNIAVFIGYSCIARTSTMFVHSTASSIDVCQVWGIKDRKKALQSKSHDPGSSLGHNYVRVEKEEAKRGLFFWLA